MKKLAVLVFILCSCVAKESIRMETQDFGPFSIDLPANWKVNKVQGIDSYVREITTGNGDTISFDFGFYSNPLEEEERSFIYPNSQIAWFLENDIDTTGMLFLNKEKVEESDREKFRKQKIIYDTIDGFKAKIVIPKKIGTGLTGVHFDSLGMEETMGKLKLTIVGTNLKSENNELFLKSIRTINIKEK